MLTLLTVIRDVWQFIAGKFEGSWILGSGNIESYDSYVTVCEKEDPADFKYVTDWIKEQ